MLDEEIEAVEEAYETRIGPDATTVRVLLGLSSSGLVDYESPSTYWAMVIELTMDWLYAAGMLSSRAGGTLGMQVMGIRIARVDGSPVTFSRAT